MVARVGTGAGREMRFLFDVGPSTAFHSDCLEPCKTLHVPVTDKGLRSLRRIRLRLEGSSFSACADLRKQAHP